MSSEPTIRCEFTGRIEPLAPGTFLTFYEDDYLLRFEHSGDTATLWCVTRYGSQPAEMFFEGVSEVLVRPEDFNSGAPWEPSDYRFRKVGDRLSLLVRDVMEVPANKGKMKFVETDLLEVKFECGSVKLASLIELGGDTYRAAKSQDVESPKHLGLILLIGVALIALVAYLSAMWAR